MTSWIADCEGQENTRGSRIGAGKPQTNKWLSGAWEEGSEVLGLGAPLIPMDSGSPKSTQVERRRSKRFAGGEHGLSRSKWGL